MKFVGLLFFFINISCFANPCPDLFQPATQRIGKATVYTQQFPVLNLFRETPEQLKEDEIRVFSLDTSENLPLELFEEVFSPSEAEQLRTMKSDTRKREFQYSRGLLKLIMANYLDIKPADVRIGSVGRGKPVLLNDDIHFNISHTKDKLIIAISKEKLGIDIECIDHERDISRIAEYTFTELERQALATGESLDPRKFFRLWTQKEAYLKALGVGLERMPSSFHIVNFDSNRPSILDSKDLFDWKLYTLDVMAGYSFSIVHPSYSPNIQLNQIVID